MTPFRLATLESVVAAALWGFGFIAAIWGMGQLGPFALCFSRFALAATLLVPVAFHPKGRALLKEYAPLAFWPGVLFAALLLMQTWGLEYTTATKSGFITTLYVVFMPIAEAVILRRIPGPKLLSSVTMAFLGTLLIVNIGLNSLNRGDGLTLLCALFATAQIYVVGRISPNVRSPFVFNLVQAGWAALLCSPFAMNAEFWSRVAHFTSWTLTEQIGILALGFGSTVIAFGLQVRAQQVLPPTLSGLLFLLESPFAMLFAVLLLGEKLAPIEVYGAILIFLAAILACLPSFSKETLLSLGKSSSVEG